MFIDAAEGNAKHPLDPGAKCLPGDQPPPADRRRDKAKAGTQPPGTDYEAVACRGGRRKARSSTPSLPKRRNLNETHVRRTRPVQWAVGSVLLRRSTRHGSRAKPMPPRQPMFARANSAKKGILLHSVVQVAQCVLQVLESR